MLGVVRLLKDTTLYLAKVDTKSRARFFLLRALFYPREIARWVAFIGDYARTLGLFEIPSYVLRKPVRSYAAYGLSIRKRVAMAMSHHLIMRDAAPSYILQQLFRGDAIVLSALQGRKCAYGLRAIMAHETYREGEIAFLLSDASGDLAKITMLVFETSQGERALLIGGLQGPRGDDAKQRVIFSTRDLFGMRPKQLVFEAAKEFAHLLGCETLFAVSNARHVSIQADRLADKLHIRADYDVFWNERGLEIDPIYGFRLNLAKFPARDSVAVSKKDHLRQQLQVAVLKLVAHPH